MATFLAFIVPFTTPLTPIVTLSTVISPSSMPSTCTKSLPVIFPATRIPLDIIVAKFAFGFGCGCACGALLASTFGLLLVFFSFLLKNAIFSTPLIFNLVYM